MIPIKEHNNIVEKLMKELESKQQQLKNTLKQKTKSPSQAPQLKPTNNEQLLTKKINQLNKQHKQRVSTLEQNLRSKSIQNKDLKERLILKQNMQVKQKEHIAEILKKTYDRKPSSGADYKISALVSHYDAELEKKSKFIESLQKKIKVLEDENSQTRDCIDSNENYKTVNSTEEGKGMTLTDHQREMTRARAQIQKFRKLFEEKDKEYRDLSRRYSELTNEYYKIVNSYGVEDTRAKPKSLTSIKNEKWINNTPFTKTMLKSKPKTNALENLLDEMVGSESQPEEVTFLNKKTFSSRVANIPSEATFLKQQNQHKEESPEEQSWQIEKNQKERQALMKVEEVMQELQIDDPQEIIPYILQLKTNSSSYNLLDTIARSLQAFFYNVGRGKIKRQDLVNALEDLQTLYNRNLEAVDILDEICIEAGAKRQKLQARIKELTEVSNQYHSKLKSIKFVQDLAKGNKVKQFIQFFELDREELVLPQQLLKIQEQLKAIDKFVKQCRVILEVGQSTSQQVLQLVLRYLEKTTSLVSQLEKKKPRPPKIAE